jgi:hypothetical protein
VSYSEAACRFGYAFRHAQLSEEIASLTKMSGPALRARYAKLFCDATKVGNG